MNIIIFGFGELGKKLLDECLDYICDYNVIAIVDNNAKRDKYREIPFQSIYDINCLKYDEIWITTVYFNEIISQLLETGIDRSKMRFVEPVVPILEYRMKKLYLLDNNECKQESDYIRHNHLRMYPYDFYDEYLYMKSPIIFDEKTGLFYGIYNNHRMYLARRFNTEQKARAYFNAVVMEQDKRSPHCYWNDEQILNQSGNAVDVGAAEGIFGLKILEQVDHLYMVEVDEEWIEALKITYKDYMDKVTIINRFVGNLDVGKNAKLDTLFADVHIDLIKMDIEGAEIDALLGTNNLLNESKPVLAVCVYHHKDDNQKIQMLLESKGYLCTNSEGYVVCQGDWELDMDEVGFRKALLFGK